MKKLEFTSEHNSLFGLTIYKLIVPDTFLENVHFTDILDCRVSKISESLGALKLLVERIEESLVEVKADE